MSETHYAECKSWQEVFLLGRSMQKSVFQRSPLVAKCELQWSRNYIMNVDVMLYSHKVKTF
jgi:hypothetical protein